MFSLVQKKGSVDVEDLVGKASARAVELEKQVCKVRTLLIFLWTY